MSLSDEATTRRRRALLEVTVRPSLVGYLVAALIALASVYR